MRITILILLFCICLVSAKYLPYESSDTSVLHRSRRSDSDESVPSIDREDSSGNEEEDEESGESASKNGAEEKQKQKLLERQEKARLKEVEAQRKLEEKQAKQQLKAEAKREKEEQKRIEKEKRKLEKLERKKQEEQQKQINKLQKETLNGELSSGSGLLDTEEDNSVELGEIWRNHIYVKYGLTLLSTKAEKQAAINKYMQEELGLGSNSTETERRQAIVKLIQTKLQNDTASRDALKNQLLNHINAVSLHKLRTDLDTNMEKLNNKSEILNNVTLPWAAVAQESLKEQRSFLQTISQFLSNILPNWGTTSNNQFESSSNNSSNDSISGNDFDGSTIVGDTSTTISLDTDTPIENIAGTPSSSSTNDGSSSVANGGVSINNSPAKNVNNNIDAATNDADGSAVSLGVNDEPSLSTDSVTSAISDTAISNSDNAGSASGSSIFSLEGNKDINNIFVVNSNINNESQNGPSSTVISVSEEGNVVSENEGTTLNAETENNSSPRNNSSSFGSSDGAISNKENDWSKVPTLSVESPESTDTKIDQTITSSTSPNSNIVSAGVDDTSLNNNAEVESPNVPLIIADSPSSDGNDIIISTGPTGNSDVVLDNVANIESGSPIFTDTDLVNGEGNVASTSNNVNTESPDLLSINNNNSPTAESSIDINTSPNIGAVSSVSSRKDEVVSSNNVNIDVQNENNSYIINSKDLTENADSVSTSVDSITSNRAENTIIDDNKSTSRNTIENESVNSVSAISDGRNDLVTTSDVVTDSSVTDTGAVKLSTSDFNAPLNIAVAQINDNNGVSVTTELSNISDVVVNASDVNMSSVIHENEIVNNDTVTPVENVIIGTEETVVDTASAQNSGIEQGSGIVSSTQLNPTIIATNTEIPTPANEVISDVNTASNNAATEPSLNGWVKELINAEIPVEQSTLIDNIDGVTIPAEPGATVVEILEQL